jgi:hypothetical protein
LTGIVVGPVKTSNTDPDSTVKLPGRTGTAVAEERTTIVVPEITVVLPSSGRLGFAGTVVGPVKTANVEPDTIVMLPGRAGMVVRFGMTKREVPSTTVVLPVNPGGAFCTGIEVGVITSSGVPLTIVVLPTEGPAGDGEAFITELMIEPTEGVGVGVVVPGATSPSTTTREGKTVETVESVKSPPTPL